MADEARMQIEDVKLVWFFEPNMSCDVVPRFGDAAMPILQGSHCWKWQITATATVRGGMSVTKDRSTMSTEERDLDDVQNKALHPVFQTTLQTLETSAVVSELEDGDEEAQSRRKAVLFKYLSVSYVLSRL